MSRRHHETYIIKYMQFIEATARVGADALKAELTDLLSQGKRVLWFTSGGSNIPLTVQIMNELDEPLTKLLTIMPIDERFGPVGHENSNVQQLLDAGFTPKRATFIPVLTNASLETTVVRYEEALTHALAANDAVIAQLGMGPDGHVAGILPGSSAVNANTLVTNYQGPDFMRVTLTFPALRRITSAYLFAYGDNKKQALEDLRDKDLPLSEQPAQILKVISKAYVYNNQVE